MMKFTLLLIYTLPLILASCTTVGSYDRIKLAPVHADYVADTMTKELVSFPRPVVTPKGKPLFDSFNNEFEERGWDISTYDIKQLPDLKVQDRYITIKSDPLTRYGWPWHRYGDFIVRMNTPFFDIHQTFTVYKDGYLQSTSQPSLHLKAYER